MMITLMCLMVLGASSWLVTIFTIPGRIGSWGFAFLLLFQERIEGLFCHEGVGMIFAEHLADPFQHLTVE